MTYITSIYNAIFNAYDCSSPYPRLELNFTETRN